jgi:SEC-C motif domain protein
MLAYTACCLPILEEHRRAKTAEALMRSRYTAFVMKNEQHILASWQAQNRPKNLDFDNFPVVWLGLQIHEIHEGAEQDSSGAIDFTSTYLENGQFTILRERSKFCQEAGLWYYVAGECEIKRHKVERNSLCPCGSGTKFKRCCLPKTLV